VAVALVRVAGVDLVGVHPNLVDVFGAEYVDKLLGDHDGAIRTARRLVELASLDSLDDAQVAEAVAGARSILPHVSDCDGLSIMVERFPEERIDTILDTRQRALTADVDLPTWAGDIYGDPAISSASTVASLIATSLLAVNSVSGRSRASSRRCVSATACSAPVSSRR
jgi:hypothetical protein